MKKLLQNTQARRTEFISKYSTSKRYYLNEQYLWAIDLLHVDEYWQSSVSPMQLTFKPTGQQIRFKGADDPRKIKSQTFRQGYTKFKHFEEVTLRAWKRYAQSTSH